MGKNWKMFLLVGAIVVLAGLGSIFVLGRAKNNENISQNETGVVAGAVSSDGNYVERLAQHLRDLGMVLYGSSQSDETKDQLKLFGEANIDYVECDAATNSSNPDECIGQNITVYPTWVFNGVKYESNQTLSELAKITDFEQ